MESVQCVGFVGHRHHSMGGGCASEGIFVCNTGRCPGLETAYILLCLRFSCGERNLACTRHDQGMEHGVKRLVDYVDA